MSPDTVPVPSADEARHLVPQADEGIYGGGVDFSGTQGGVPPTPSLKEQPPHLRSSADEALYGRDLDNSGPSHCSDAGVRTPLAPSGHGADGGMGVHATGMEMTAPFTDRYESLRGHTPPPAPPADTRREPGIAGSFCATRSELLARRKQAYIEANEERKRAHEEANPIWAATLSSEPGLRKASHNRTLTQIEAERRKDRVATAVLSSGEGVLERDKQIMLASNPIAVVTSISRPDAYGAELSLAFREAPDHPTRSELVAHRRAELLRENAKTMRQIGASGYRSFYQRVGDRLDSFQKLYYDSQEQGGAAHTRSKMLASRRDSFISENDQFLRRHRAGEVKECNYADQKKPFWTLGREMPNPAVTSHHALVEAQQWYRKPEVFVPGREPREQDPFKAGDATRLAHKLSSGPKRYQRGYPAQTQDVTGNIQAMDAPPADAYQGERKASVKDTLRFLDFKLQAEKDAACTASTGTDMAMEAPMYSSFSKDGIFREPYRAPRPGVVQQSRKVERSAAGSEAPAGGANDTLATITGSGAPRSPLLMSTMQPSKPGTAASVRSGGFQIIDSLGV